MSFMQNGGDPLCDCCGLMYPPGYHDPARFHRVWPYSDFHICESCLQELISACDMSPIRRDASVAIDNHAHAMVTIAMAERAAREGLR